MPAAMQRSCAGQGGTCPNFVTGRGRCPACQAQQQRVYDDRRGSAASRGYGPRWAKVSSGLRRRQLRWCGDTMPGVPTTGDSTCPQEGVGRVPSRVVDHIVPVTGPKDPRFWQPANWAGLCATCHDKKRGREAHGVYGERVGPEHER